MLEVNYINGQVLLAAPGHLEIQVSRSTFMGVVGLLWTQFSQAERRELLQMLLPWSELPFVAAVSIGGGDAMKDDYIDYGGVESACPIGVATELGDGTEATVDIDGDFFIDGSIDERRDQIAQVLNDIKALAEKVVALHLPVRRIIIGIGDGQLG